MTKILAINAGSSSLKFQLFTMPAEKLMIKGLFERIGLAEEVVFSCVINDQKITQQLQVTTYQACIEFLLPFLIEQEVIQNLAEIEGIGHRVAHGGEVFKQASWIDEASRQAIDKLSPLAPLHNPVNLIGIEAFQAVLPKCPQIGVFDTSFHQTMPEKNYLYPIPYEYYAKNQIRRYGFHGTSHQYVAMQAAQHLEKEFEQLSAITCHIGNGVSLCAIKNGQSVMTSMGFTPLVGAMMGTRCGDIDPSIIPFLQNEKGLSTDEVLKIMNEKSGLLGISQISNDTRDIIEAAQSGDKQAILALEMYVSRIRQTIGAYATELGHLDALIFTAGVGENSALIRAMVTKNLNILGIEVDEMRNQANALFIETPAAKVKVLIVPTNEELMIAQETYGLVQKGNDNSKKKYHILNKSAI